MLIPPTVVKAEGMDSSSDSVVSETEIGSSGLGNSEQFKEASPSEGSAILGEDVKNNEGYGESLEEGNYNPINQKLGNTDDSMDQTSEVHNELNHFDSESSNDGLELKKEEELVEEKVYHSELEMEAMDVLAEDFAQPMFLRMAKTGGDDLFQWLKDSLAGITEDKAEIVLKPGQYKFNETITIPENKDITIKNDTGEVVFLRDPKLEKEFIIIPKGASVTIESEDNKLVFDGNGADEASMNQEIIYKSDKVLKPSQGHYGNGLGFIRNEGKLTVNGGVFKNYVVDNFDGRTIDPSRQTSFNAPIVSVGEDAELIFNDGEIANNHYRSVWYSSTGILAKDGAKVTINGGKIHGNTNYEEFHRHAQASAIAGYDGAEITINDVDIYNNQANGASVFIGSVDSEISTIAERENEATVEKELSSREKKINLATLELNGGKIHNNKKPDSQVYTGTWVRDLTGTGGVYVLGNAKFTMNGGEISQNETPGHGGGVLTYDGYTTGLDTKNFAKSTIERWNEVFPATFIMNDGVIKENKAYTGGGIYIANLNSELNGGLIQGNEAKLQGGGVYVASVPYVLKVKNAFIGHNEATADYKETDIIINDKGLKLTQGTGGGSWFCPTGDAKFFAENGAFFFKNDASGAADDFKSDAKETEGDEALYFATLPSRLPNGAKIEWFKDSHPDRYDEENSIAQENLKNITESISLKAINYEENEEMVKSFAKLFVIENKANRGGGFGSNGSIIFGVENAPKKELKILKEWKDVPIKKAVKVQIYGKRALDDGTVQEWIIEELWLNEDNKYTATLKELPSTVNGEDIENLIHIRELTDDYIWEASKVEKDEENSTTDSIAFKISLINKPKPVPNRNQGPGPDPDPEPDPEPELETEPEPDPDPEPDPEPEPDPKPILDPAPEPEFETEPEPELETESIPDPESKPELKKGVGKQIPKTGGTQVATVPFLALMGMLSGLIFIGKKKED